MMTSEEDFKRKWDDSGAAASREIAANYIEDGGVASRIREGLASTISIGIPVAVAQRAVDALCRAHKMCLQLDCARAVLAGQEEIAESALTSALDTSTQEMRVALEAAGIAW